MESSETSPDGDPANKRSASGYEKEAELAETARQQTFEHFAVDWNWWYCTNDIATSLYRGMVLVHKPTRRPFVVIANLPTEEFPLLDYVFYTDVLDQSNQCYLHQLVDQVNAHVDAPLVMGASHETYLKMGELSYETSEAHRIALMSFLGFCMQQPEPEAAEKMARERRVVKAERKLAEIIDTGHDDPAVNGDDEARGGMDVDDCNR
jgi:hypothetical protein